MKPCVIIPCYNHPSTVAAVAKAAQEFCPVIVIDDGSSMPLLLDPETVVVRLDPNRGKGAALRAGFAHAQSCGFTHAITMDADGQHFAADLPRFLSAAESNEKALIVGVRDFAAAGAPAGRRRSNAISTFWYRVETGIRLTDTQCGFRCYPISLTEKLKARSGRFTFEMEFLVRAAWSSVPIIPVSIHSHYNSEHIRLSHFRPVEDFLRIAWKNVGWVLQAWFVPQGLRAAWSLGARRPISKVLREFLSEHAHDPLRLSLATGLGLFFAVAPIWGFQMIAAAAVAHVLRLNKAITLLASNVSIPPLVPFILYAALVLGHWICTGQLFQPTFQEITDARAMDYFLQWVVGSVALGGVIGMAGIVITYAVATLLWKE